MRHRHLDLAEGVWSVAAVHSALERGGATDIYKLIEALRADPWGPTAVAAERAITSSEVYGYPRLLGLCLERFRAVRRGGRSAP